MKIDLDTIPHSQSQSIHLDFIVAAANLHAFNYGLRGDTDLALFKRVADSVPVPEFAPKSGFKVQVSDNDAPPDNASSGKCHLPK